MALEAKHHPYLARGVANLAKFTLGAEAGNVRNVAVQLKDANGKNAGVRSAVKWYLSGAATGATLAAAPSGGVAIGTNGLLIENIAERSGLAITDAQGRFDVNITEVGVLTLYLVLIMVDGSLVISPAIAFV